MVKGDISWSDDPSELNVQVVNSRTSKFARQRRSWHSKIQNNEQHNGGKPSRRYKIVRPSHLSVHPWKHPISEPLFKHTCSSSEGTFLRIYMKSTGSFTHNTYREL
ncbi:unnamed protein product [Rhodiola kirilowii]